MAWAYQDVVSAGIQILLCIALGWAFVHAHLLESDKFMPQINVIILRVAFPTLTIYLLGIKLDLMDAEAWRSLAAYVLWNTLVQCAILAYVWVFRQRDLGEAALLNLVLTANNTIIIGLPVMEATFNEIGGRLSLLTAFPLFLQVIPFSLTFFEIEKWMVEHHNDTKAREDAANAAFDALPGGANGGSTAGSGGGAPGEAPLPAAAPGQSKRSALGVSMEAMASTSATNSVLATAHLETVDETTTDDDNTPVNESTMESMDAIMAADGVPLESSAAAAPAGRRAGSSVRFSVDDVGESRVPHSSVPAPHVALQLGPATGAAPSRPSRLAVASAPQRQQHALAAGDAGLDVEELAAGPRQTNSRSHSGHGASSAPAANSTGQSTPGLAGSSPSPPASAAASPHHLEGAGMAADAPHINSSVRRRRGRGARWRWCGGGGGGTADGEEALDDDEHFGSNSGAVVHRGRTDSSTVRMRFRLPASHSYGHGQAHGGGAPARAVPARVVRAAGMGAPDLPVPQALALSQASVKRVRKARQGSWASRLGSLGRQPHASLADQGAGGASPSARLHHVESFGMWGRILGAARHGSFNAMPSGRSDAAMSFVDAARLPPRWSQDPSMVRAAVGSMMRRHGGLLGAWRRWMARPSPARHITWAVLKNPLLWSLLLAMLVNLSQLRTLLDPASSNFVRGLSWVAGTLRWLSNITVPLSLFSNGVWLHGKSFTKQTVIKAAVLLAIKLLLLAPLQLVCAAVLRLPAEAAMSLMLLSICPVASTSFVIAAQYNHGADVVTATTLAGIFLLVPALLTALQLPKVFGLYDYTLSPL